MDILGKASELLGGNSGNPLEKVEGLLGDGPLSGIKEKVEEIPIVGGMLAGMIPGGEHAQAASDDSANSSDDSKDSSGDDSSSDDSDDDSK